MQFVSIHFHQRHGVAPVSLQLVLRVVNMLAYSRAQVVAKLNLKSCRLGGKCSSSELGKL